jgi:8-oxo-dGTP diphosphatase
MIEAIVWVLLLKDNNIFLLKNAIDNREEWTLVGGHVEFLESLKSALKREIEEEVGVKVKEENLIFQYIIDRQLGTQHKIHFFFRTTDWENDPCNKEVDRHLAGAWHSLNELPTNLGPLARRAIQSLNNDELYDHVS